MEKKLFLAIALSLLVLLSWQALVSKTQPVANKEVTTKITPQIDLQAAKNPLPAQETPKPATSFKYTKDRFEIIFLEEQAAVKEVIFKNHLDSSLNLYNGFLLTSNSLHFKKGTSNAQEVVFEHKDFQKKIVKRFIFDNSSYNIWLEVNVQNTSNAPLSLDSSLTLGQLHFTPQNKQAQFQDVTIATQEKVNHLNARQDLQFSETKFVSLRDRYFCAIIQPQEKGLTGFVKKVDPQISEIGLKQPIAIIGPGEQQNFKFRIYLGPQELQSLNSINPQWSSVLYYGTFDFIAHILIQLLDFIQRLVHNWGLTIIIFSLLVYFALFPLSMKQMHSMKKMQSLQPHIEEVRKAHKDNPQRMNKEIMELYKTHKVNPFGGCLPLILQMPIFFALYQVLMRSVFLKGARFLWIKDLSEPDKLFLLPVNLPVLGNQFNILPIVMAIGMFIQQKVSMKATTGANVEQQKMMTIIMPILFGLIFYHMPSGLVLYWFVNSALMLAYQLRINRT